MPLAGFVIFPNSVSAATNGILAEYFAMPDSTCDSETGSTLVLDKLLPNITRKVSILSFRTVSEFDLDRCAFEAGPSGQERETCRGSNEIEANFAARYTGTLKITEAGFYTFQVEANDGVRMILGHSACPGSSCGDRETMMNTRLSDLQKIKEEAYGQLCEECTLGGDTCFTTLIGCQPFPMWQLEGDNGYEGTCLTGTHTWTGTRYLMAGAHPFKVEYFQRSADAKLIISYSGPDTSYSLVTIPWSAWFYPVITGTSMQIYWTEEDKTALPPFDSFGQVYSEATLLYTEDYSLDNADMSESWTENLPGRIWGYLTSKDGGSIYIRWTGVMWITNADTYYFQLESDDASRLSIGGRGLNGETVVVENDGIKASAESVTGSMLMLPGWTPFRLEYLYSPDAIGPWGDTGLPSPPHFQVLYKGNDTNDLYLELGQNGGRNLRLADPDCEITNWEWGDGMVIRRDCGGTCYQDNPDSLGDGVCDKGTTTSNDFYCSLFDYDQNDCESDPGAVFTTARPSNPCLVSCPAGNFKRKDCSQCDATNEDGTMCIVSEDPTCTAQDDDPPGICNFGRCCVVKLWNLDYWDEDCLAFGAYENCTVALDNLLSEIKLTPRSLSSQAVNPTMKTIRTKMMEDCEGEYCNEITTEFEVDTKTLTFTDEYVCPIYEAEEKGVECFVGPWLDADESPLDDCQDDAFEYNFCKNRKTKSGRPFVRCCSFVYLNYAMDDSCLFVGIEEGTCAGYLAKYKASVSGSIYTAINTELVNQNCEADSCNDPANEETGCPSVVVERPWQVVDLLPEDLDRDSLLTGGGTISDETFPWQFVVFPICGVILTIVAACMAIRCIKEKETPTWHSAKAKVVAIDTFVEPTADPDKDMVDKLNDPALTYGVVPKRPAALTQIVRSDNMLELPPRALRRELAGCNMDMVEAAFIAANKEEAEVKGLTEETMMEHAELIGQGLTQYRMLAELPQRVAQEALDGYCETMANRLQDRSEYDDHEGTFDALPAPALQDGGGGGPIFESTQDQVVAAALQGDYGQLALPLPGVPDGRSAKRTLALANHDEEEVAGNNLTLSLPPPPTDNREELRMAAQILSEQQRMALPPCNNGSMTTVDAMQMSITVGTFVAPPHGSIPSHMNGRPAATARFLRQAQTGQPRVAT